MQQLWLLVLVEVIIIDVAFVRSHIVDRCELVSAFRSQRPSIDHHELNRWICVAQQQSKFDTSSINVDSDAGYHGLFHLSDRYWCANVYADIYERACQMTCDQLKDANVHDDIACAQKVFNEHQRISGDGFSAWPVTRTACANPPDLVSDCGGSGRASFFGQNSVFSTPTSATYSTASSSGNLFQDNIFFNGQYSARPNNYAPAVTQRNIYASSRQLPVPVAQIPQGKVYDRCELARELRYQHDIPLEQIHTWVCIAKHESSFRTSAIGRLNTDGSTDHGLFQISNIYWCSNSGRGKGCQAQCSDFENADISDDVRCIRQIWDEHQRLFGNGFHAWTVYDRNCRHITPQFTQDCFGAGHDDENAIVPSYNIQPQRTPVKPYNKSPSGKVYERCELAKELRYQHNIPMNQIHTWVCIAQHESSFRTSVIGRLNADGSTDHGLFQISNIYWCDTDTVGKACNAKCSEFEDSDITNDVNCIRQIYNEHQTLFGNGFHAWSVYEPHCRHVTKQFTKDCFADVNQYVASTTLAPWRHVNDEENAVTPSSIFTKTTVKRRIDGGKVFDRCELARELKYTHSLPAEQIATWVCIAYRESSFRTWVVGNGEDHGLFQISSQYWCSKSGAPGKACNARCSDFLDSDITDDVNCLRQVFNEHQRLFGNGFHAWTVYEPYCKNIGQNYVSDCFASTPSYGTIYRTSPYTTTSSYTSHPTLNVQTSFRSTYGYNTPVTTPAQTTYNPYSYSFTTPTTTPSPTTSYSIQSYSTTPKPTQTHYIFNGRTTTTPFTTYSVTTPAPYTNSNYIFSGRTSSSPYYTASTTPYQSTTSQPTTYSYVSTSPNSYATQSSTAGSSVNSVFDLYLNKWTKASTIPPRVTYSSTTTPYYYYSTTPYQVSTPSTYTTSPYYSSLSPVYSSTYSSTPYTRSYRRTTEAFPKGNSTISANKLGVEKKDVYKVDGEKKTTIALTTKLPTTTSTTRRTTVTTKTSSIATTTRKSTLSIPTLTTKPSATTTKRSWISQGTSPLTTREPKLSTTIKSTTVSPIETKKTTAKIRSTKTSALTPTTQSSNERSGRRIAIENRTNINASSTSVNPLSSKKPTTLNDGRYVEPPSTRNAGLYTPFSKDSWHPEPVKTPGATMLLAQGVRVDALASNLTKASYTASRLTPIKSKPIASFSFGINVPTSTQTTVTKRKN